MKFTAKKYIGYEVSSAGDRRFSAFCALLSDGRSIEEHYQCDVKGYDPGGRNWKAGKGRPAKDPNTDLWSAYLGLWREWATANLGLMEELRGRARACGYALSDKFAKTPINQARALAQILNEMSTT